MIINSYNSNLGYLNTIPKNQHNKICRILFKETNCTIINDSEKTVLNGCNFDILIHLVFEYGYNRTKTYIEKYSSRKINGCYKELKNPKTIYSLCHDSNNTCFDISKTEYNFVDYLIANFSSLSDITEYINNEYAINNSSEPIAEKLTENNDSYSEHEKTLESIADTYINTNIEKLCTDIYNKYNYPMNYNALKLCAAISTIDNVYSKYYIKECIRLKANKASRKIFETLTEYSLSDIKDINSFVDTLESDTIDFPNVYTLHDNSIIDDIPHCLLNLSDKMNADNKSGTHISGKKTNTNVLQFLSPYCFIVFNNIDPHIITDIIDSDIPESDINMNTSDMIQQYIKTSGKSYNISVNRVIDIESDIIGINNDIYFNAYYLKNIMMILKTATIKYFGANKIAMFTNDNITAALMPIAVKNANSKTVTNIEL